MVIIYDKTTRLWLREHDQKGALHEDSQSTREHTTYKGQLILIVLVISLVFHSLSYDFSGSFP